MDTKAIVQEFRRVAALNDWGSLHSAQNLSQALSVEVGELLVAVSDAGTQVPEIAAEIADVQMYLLVLADTLNIDITQAIKDKQTYNRRRFNPAKQSLS